MNLTSSRIIKQILAEHDVKPNKRLGQNFLIDRGAIRKMLKTAELKRTDVVLEIGPGLGALTQEIAPLVRKLVAVEKDKGMVEILKELLKDVKNIELIHADILKWNSGFMFYDSGFKIIANLPYYLTAPVIRKFLETAKVRPWTMVLMVQKEVAQRICAQPPKMNLLAVSVQFYATPKIIGRVSKHSFWPSPRVDSAILKITPHSTKQDVEAHEFFTIVKAGFSQPRKQLANNLSKQLHLPKKQIESWLLQNNIKPNQRAETLTIQDWIHLAATLCRE